MDLERQVNGGRDAERLEVHEWHGKEDYVAVIEVVKEVIKTGDLRVYVIYGKRGHYVVFILTKMDDGLIGVRAEGVAT